MWDYPRPPALEHITKRLIVRFAKRTLADTTNGIRILETSHPPVYYFPPGDIDTSLLNETVRTTFCEFKGTASYVDAVVGDRATKEVGWRFLAPSPGYADLQGHVAFYANKVDECSVDGEVVEPQPGGFYGGWITTDVAGPFKGEPDSWGW